MKYLKTYKLFEALVEDIIFIRMSHTDMLNGSEEGWFQPTQRRAMIGPDAFNNALVKVGFPDKQRCVHFMSEESYDIGYSGYYGEKTFQVTIDDKSKLGWSFVVPINDWFFKAYQIRNSFSAKLVSDIMNTPFGKIEANPQTTDGIDESLNYLLDFEAIGTGTIEDLKKSPHYGKYKLFVWTTDKVYLKRCEKNKVEDKKPRPYKNKPVLNSEDFINRGLKPTEIGNFYQSEFGKKIKELQSSLGRNTRLREEALKLLDEWVKNK